MRHVVCYLSRRGALLIVGSQTSLASKIGEQQKQNEKENLIPSQNTSKPTHKMGVFVLCLNHVIFARRDAEKQSDVIMFP